ncbi:MAG: arginase family protein [Cytophagales bacterium]|nr:arginase family protein [Cytophagales bacterium]
MDLKHFFSPVYTSLRQGADVSNDMYTGISFFHDQECSLEEFDIALIGLRKYFADSSPDHIRAEFYRLKKGRASCRIVDMGNFLWQEDLEKSCRELRQVYRFLMQRQVVPVILGGDAVAGCAQFSCCSDFVDRLSFLCVGARLQAEQPVIRMMLETKASEKPFFHFSHLAYQTYLTDYKVLDLLHSKGFEAHRLGKVRQSLPEIEPVVREADAMLFDLGAIRSLDFPATADPQPFGLSAEEACQLCWYAGHSEKMSSFGLVGFEAARDDELHRSAKVSATMLWYFVEGYYNRKEELESSLRDYIKYLVPLSGVRGNEMITFYKSQLSEKWWMEIPVFNEKGEESSVRIPCSKRDYELAMNGEVPSRYILGMGRYG